MTELKHTFPVAFFAEEDRLGFHIDRMRKEIWAVELDMLYELDRVCKKLNIRYFLDGGTLLGAARDGRFIPWDDDIDVAMLREDYDRFLREAPGEFEHPFFLQSAYNDPGYFRGHAQLRNSNTAAILPHELGEVSFNQGMFLDIFVLDELFPDRAEGQYAARERLFRQREVWNHHDYHPNPIRRAVRWGRYLLYRTRYPDSSSFYARIEKIFRARRKSRYVDYLMYYHSAEEIHCLEREWYEQTVELSFEGTLFPAPAGYAEYLARYYGEDYMTPKAVSSDHCLGGSVIYDVNQSYTEVLKELKEEQDAG